jgi:hypothetical protein
MVAFGDRFHLRVASPAGPLARLPHALRSAGATVTALQPIAPTLEDVFLALQSGQVAHDPLAHTVSDTGGRPL